jgi:hypothetical protein
MKRREFLVGIGLCGYSLVVRADESKSGPSGALPARRDALYFERIAPPGGQTSGRSADRRQ